MLLQKFARTTVTNPFRFSVDLGSFKKLHIVLQKILHSTSRRPKKQNIEIGCINYRTNTFSLILKMSHCQLLANNSNLLPTNCLQKFKTRFVINYETVVWLDEASNP